MLCKYWYNGLSIFCAEQVSEVYYSESVGNEDCRPHIGAPSVILILLVEPFAYPGFFCNLFLCLSRRFTGRP